MSDDAEARPLHPVALRERPGLPTEVPPGEDTLLALLMGALISQLQRTGQAIRVSATEAPPTPIDVTSERPLALSVAEAAKLLRVSRTHVYELIRRDELPSVRLGRRVVVPRIAIERLLEGSADRHTTLRSGPPPFSQRRGPVS